MLILAEKKYDGTIERRIALILDNYLMVAEGEEGAIKLVNPREGMDGLIKRIADAVKEEMV
jgi:hypothetical protein